MSPPPGYTLVRTDELEAAITAYLANDDPGLRGAMADLSAAREMGTRETGTRAWRVDFWTDRPVSELIADAGAEPVENPADLELQGISDESWVALGRAAAMSATIRQIGDMVWHHLHDHAKEPS